MIAVVREAVNNFWDSATIVMARETVRLHINTLVAILVFSLGAMGAWLAFIHPTPNPTLVPFGFLGGFTALLMGIVLLRNRWHGVALLSGWYLMALSPIPWIWSRFYGPGDLPGHGSLVGAGIMVLIVAVSSLPARWVPKPWFSRVPGIGVLLAMVLSALPPLFIGSTPIFGPAIVGMSTPWLAAGALLPGVMGHAHGWMALLLLVGMIAVVGVIRKENVVGKSAFLVIASILTMSSVLLARGSGPGPLVARTGGPPVWQAWGMNTRVGEVPDPDTQFAAYQTFERRFRVRINAAILAGARFILTPEGMDPQWSALERMNWSGTAKLARQYGATVLLGVYSPIGNKQPQNWADGLVNLGSGQSYHNQISLPISMWRPWAEGRMGSFPMSPPSRFVATPYGSAGLLVCYEQVLIWPMIWSMRPWNPDHPALLLAIANQWFVHGRTDWIGRPQARSMLMQSFLWNLPLLQATNWSRYHFTHHFTSGSVKKQRIPHGYWSLL